MPSSQVSRKALICSGWRVASSALPSLTSRLRVLTCQLRAELDAVGRVHVDHLDLALEALLLGQRGHHQQRVAEDHPVGPVLLVAVELDELLELDAVEVVEERQLGLGLALARRVAQVLDDRLRADLLLDVDGDDRHLEVAARPARPCPSRRAAGRATGRGGRASSPGALRHPRTKPRSSLVGMLVRLSWWRGGVDGLGAVGLLLAAISSLLRLLGARRCSGRVARPRSSGGGHADISLSTSRALARDAWLEVDRRQPLPDRGSAPRACSGRCPRQDRHLDRMASSMRDLTCTGRDHGSDECRVRPRDRRVDCRHDAGSAARPLESGAVLGADLVALRRDCAIDAEPSHESARDGCQSSHAAST